MDAPSTHRRGARAATADALKPVVFIGGAPGTGKSTLAGDLSARLQFDHRLGTGFIRAVLETEVSPALEPGLFSLTYQAEDPVAHLEWQARRLQAAVTACVQRARSEGTSLIVEGSHLLPALYREAAVDRFVVLGAPAPDVHLERLRGPTHQYRRISAHDWHNIQRIDAYYREQAARHGVPTVVYEDLQPVLALLGDVAPSLRRGRPGT